MRLPKLDKELPKTANIGLICGAQALEAESLQIPEVNAIAC
jgi:hypothetical protein